MGEGNESKTMQRIIPIIPTQNQSAALAEEALQLKALPPLALYIHFPWCVKKCPYCDFNSHQLPDFLPEDAYINALLADLESALPHIWGRQIISIFMGGGTPSLFLASSIDRLISEIRARVSLQAAAEITLEANPGTVDFAKFAGFKSAGITRLSLGIQSFNDAHLQALGRIHSGANAQNAARAASDIFARVNFDLMYGLPNQTEKEALNDLQTALSFSPTHLSCYQLTLEPHTAFFAQPPALPEDDACAKMGEAIQNYLRENGFIHYETSAFAQNNHFCQHNLNYWHFGDYLGIGAGAHSKISFANKIKRQMRHKSPQAYLKNAADNNFIQEEFTVEKADLPLEFMMNALRLNQGFDLSIFSERTGISFNLMIEPLKKAQQDGLILLQNNRITPTDLGQRFLNKLLNYF